MTGLWPAWWWTRSPQPVDLRVLCEDCGMEVSVSRLVTVDDGVVCDVCWYGDRPGRGSMMTNTGGRIGTKPEPGFPVWLLCSSFVIFAVALGIAIVLSDPSPAGCPR